LVTEILNIFFLLGFFSIENGYGQKEGKKNNIPYLKKNKSASRFIGKKSLYLLPSSLLNKETAG
jgi:hypothetical protein